MRGFGVTYNSGVESPPIVASSNFIDINSYTKTPIPAEVAQFLSGSYVNNVYSEAIPDQRKLDAFESRMISLLNAAVGAFKSYKPGDAAIKTAQNVLDDIQGFKDYMQMKLQVQNKWKHERSEIRFLY